MFIVIENDIIGRVYEYFLSKFALAEGKGKGECYTPKCIVNLIAEMIEPYDGILYDPCCGSGGMFVQSMKFVEAHHGNKKKVSIYGQEYTNTTYIRMQRNKLYAHNDEQRILSNENLTDRHPILYPDVQEMIDFALDCTGLILGVLTDVNHATQYSNIDDWEGTLMLTRLGLKYQEYDFQQREKAFEAEMQRRLGGNDNGELQ